MAYSTLLKSLDDFASKPMSVQIHRRETKTSGGV
jgi:hypothetical protein